MEHREQPTRARPRRPGASAARVAALLMAGFVSYGQTSRAQTLAQPPLPSPPPAPTTQPPPATQVATGQGHALTLDDALAMAERSSEQITIAAAGVSRAESAEMRAKSDIYPQINVSASYDRTFKSEFADVFGATPTCTPLQVNAGAPIDARVSEIERALQDCPPSIFGGSSSSTSSGSSSSSADSGDNTLPFGQANAYRANLQVVQNIFTAGRITAQRQQARFNRENAGITLNSTKAQLYLDVSTAYYEAALSERLLVIAEATLAQADNTVAVTKAQREAGRVSEFDLLRAQVARNTQQPDVIRRRNARDLAHLRLKQLLDLPLTERVQLVVNLSENTLPAPAQRFATAIAEAEAGSAPRERAAVTEGGNSVRASEASVRVAHAERMPSVSVNTLYGRVAYPSSVPSFSDFRTNWTVGVAMQWAVFDGGRLKAGELSARADVAESQARLRLTRELATLDDASARHDLDAARAAWDATAGTVDQARRAYEIAELRYREGISTQLELSDSRLLLEQAEANRAQAARDLQVARVKLALLPDLPLTTTGAATPTPAQGAAPAQQPAASQAQQQPAAASQQTGTGTAATGSNSAATTGGRP
jgi:outer membrane protein